MSLCLVDSRPIEELEAMANKYFADVPKKEAVEFEIPYMLSLGKILKIVPHSQINQLSLMWTFDKIPLKW
jgi:secreted Zn-dependent insulinase-like peptidase